MKYRTNQLKHELFLVNWFPFWNSAIAFFWWTKLEINCYTSYITLKCHFSSFYIYIALVGVAIKSKHLFIFFCISSYSPFNIFFNEILFGKTIFRVIVCVVYLKHPLNCTPSEWKYWIFHICFVRIFVGTWSMSLPSFTSVT